MESRGEEWRAGERRTVRGEEMEEERRAGERSREGSREE